MCSYKDMENIKRCVHFISNQDIYIDGIESICEGICTLSLSYEENSVTFEIVKMPECWKECGDYKP